jgi:hypothetical protein
MFLEELTRDGLVKHIVVCAERCIEDAEDMANARGPFGLGIRGWSLEVRVQACVKRVESTVS